MVWSNFYSVKDHDLTATAIPLKTCKVTLVKLDLFTSINVAVILPQPMQIPTFASCQTLLLGVCAEVKSSSD